MSASVSAKPIVWWFSQPCDRHGHLGKISMECEQVV